MSEPSRCSVCGHPWAQHGGMNAVCPSDAREGPIELGYVANDARHILREVDAMMNGKPGLQAIVLAAERILSRAHGVALGAFDSELHATRLAKDVAP